MSKTSHNTITGDKLIVKKTTKEYTDNYDKLTKSSCFCIKEYVCYNCRKLESLSKQFNLKRIRIKYALRCAIASFTNFMKKGYIMTNTTIAPFKFKKVRAVTLQLFKWKNDVERYFKITSTMFLGQEQKATVDASGKTVPAQEPVTLVNCVDMETGEEGQFIVGAVLRDTFNNDPEYLDGHYVNKCFAITQKRDLSKKYNTYTVIEIELDETPNAKAK